MSNEYPRENPTRRQTLRATVGGAAALTIGTGLTMAAGDGGEGECDLDEDEYVAVREEYADPDTFEAAIEPLDEFWGDLEAHGVESMEVHEVTVRARTVECEPVPEYLALWTTDTGAGVSLKLRPESGAYQARLAPEMNRGDGGTGGDIPCYKIGKEGSLGCPEWMDCCHCERTYVESGCDNSYEPCYRFCFKTCEWNCDFCPGYCEVSVPTNPVPVA